MSIRANEIYIQSSTRRALFYIPRPEGDSVDGLADRIIYDWLVAHHPEVLDHLKAQAEADKAFREKYELRSDPTP